MATYQRPPTNPVVDAHRSARWPVFLILFLGLAAIGGGIAYDRYVANAPIVLTPSRPTEPATRSRPTQPTTPSTRPGAKPTQTSSGMPEWMPAVFFAIPIIFIGVIVLVVVGMIRRARRAAVGGATVSGGSTGHWAGGQHVGSDSGTAAAGAGGPWARAPGTATTGGRRVDQVAPARKGFSFPLLPIIVGAIILDQAVLNGRYSRMALDWIMKFVEGFTR